MRHSGDGAMTIASQPGSIYMTAKLNSSGPTQPGRSICRGETVTTRPDIFRLWDRTVCYFFNLLTIRFETLRDVSLTLEASPFGTCRQLMGLLAVCSCVPYLSESARPEIDVCGSHMIER